jgi:predicted RNA methylase
MKLKELEGWLTQCDVFESPKVALEQYATSAHIASRMVYAAQENIEGSGLF